jgi:glycosyltransferase involved in cell wall biosynthesis
VKIGFVAWRDLANSRAGGSEVLIDALASGLVRAGHSVVVVAGGPIAERSYPIRSGGGTFSQYVLAPFRAKQHLRDCDVIVDVSNGIPFFAPLWTKQPVVHLVHHVHTAQWPQHFPWPIARFGSILESRVAPRLYRWCEHVAVSPSTRQEMIELGTSERRVHVMFNPVSVQPPPARSSSPLFVVLGRITPTKRLDLVLRTWAKVSATVDGELVVIGDGAGLDASRRSAPPRTRFVGRVGDDEKHALLGSAWILLHGAAHEGWGVAILEAAAHGVPAVGFDVPGVRDAIVDGETGLLVRTEREFCEAWIDLCADPEKMVRLGQAALVRSRSFSIDATVESMLEVCRMARDGATAGGVPSRRSLRLSRHASFEELSQASDRTTPQRAAAARQPADLIASGVSSHGLPAR